MNSHVSVIACLRGNLGSHPLRRTMRRKIKFSSTLIIMIFLTSIAAIAWGGSEKEARKMYNQALILFDKQPLKAEELLKNIVSEHMDTSAATEAIRTLQMMKSLRTIEGYGNASAKTDLHNLMTAMDDYHKDHKKYATTINELEEYGLHISNESTTVTILFADGVNYVAKAFHNRGDKIYIVKGPTTFSAIHEADKIGLDEYLGKGNKGLSFKDLKYSFVDSKKAGKLFVVKGLVINNYPDRRNFIRIRSCILDSKGKVVKSKIVYAGNPISDKELLSLSMGEIDNRLMNKLDKDKANINILPLSSIPFMIVFNDLPEDIIEYTVEPISSCSAK